MAQTINVASLRVALGVTGGEYTRGELSNLTRVLNQSAPPVDKFYEQMKLLDSALKNGGISAKQFADAEEFAAKKFGVLTYAMEQQISDAKKVADADKKALEATRALADEEAKLARMVESSHTPFQRLAQDVAFLDRQYQAGKINANSYNLAVDALSKKHGVAAVYAEKSAAAETKLAKAKSDSIAAIGRGTMSNEIPDPFRGWGNVDMKTQSVNGLAGALGQVGAAGLAIGAVKSISDLGQAGLKVAMAREQIQAQMDVLTGSAAAARKLIDATVELDQKSALSAVQFQDSSKVLLGYGLSVSEVIPALNKLSEISMGNNEKMQSLTLAFGQVRANGRLMGQEVLQMVNAGFNPLQEISRTTGESMASLRKRMEDGKVSFDEVAKAMETATSAGGRFYGMNEKMAGTTAVKIAKLQTHYQNFLAGIGKEVAPGVNNALDLINKTIEDTPKRGEAMAGWWATLAGNANDYYQEIEAANKAKKTAEELDKKAVEAEATKTKLAKERADAEERKAKAQQAAVDADNKRIDSERSAFNSRIKAISEERMKAGFGGDNERFKKAQLVDNTFGMSEGEKQQAKAAIMEIDETRRLNELNAAHASIEAANKELEIQKQVAKMKDRNFLASDSLRKEYAQLDEMFRRQLAEAGNNEQQKEGIRKRAAMAEQSIMARSDFAAMQERKQKTEGRFGDPGDFIAKSIAPSMRAGSKEAAAFLLNQQADAAEKAERKKWQTDLLAETRKANKMNEAAPRIQNARI